MDAMQNDSATTVDDADTPDTDAQAKPPTNTSPDAAAPQDANQSADQSAEQPADSAPDQDADSSESANQSPDQPADGVPQPRSAEPEPASAAESNASGKAKKRKAAPKAKTAAGTKSLVVFREGKVHYADETVVVLDLDDAAHPDTDVHDVVDKLSELRDALESPGRTEAVTLVAELIQSKALA
jgi:hypothetical protein